MEAQRSHCMKLWNWSLDCLWDPKLGELSESWDTCQAELLSGSRTKSRRKSVLQSTKLERVRDLKNILISGMKMQNLLFAQLVFSLALVKYFLTYAPFPPLWNGNVSTVPLYVGSMWSVCYFYFIGHYSYEIAWISGETLNFEILSALKTVID